MTIEKGPQFIEEFAKSETEEKESIEGSAQIAPESLEVSKEGGEGSQEKNLEQLKAGALDSAQELVKAWASRKETGGEALIGAAATLIGEVREYAKILHLDDQGDKALISAVREAASQYDAADIEALLRQAGVKGEAKTEVK